MIWGAEGGFTLIEFLFSLVVFATILGGSLAALQTAQQLSEDSQSRLIAMNAARTVLELMKDPDKNLTQAAAVTTAVPLQNGSVTIDWRPANPGAGETLANTDYATFLVYIYWAPKGSTAACARASAQVADTTPIGIAGCRNIQVTTVSSRRFQ